MRVLLVEDEARIADFIRKGLTEHGYAVDVACDGEEALDWPAVADFDIIILDVMLPLRDGGNRAQVVAAFACQKLR